MASPPPPQPSSRSPRLWFDAHLDLAYLAVSGRDMFAVAAAAQAGPHPPAAVTLPELREGRVRFALATIFTEPGGSGPEGYPIGDVQRAYAVGRAQLEVYLTWRDAGRIALDLRRVLRADSGVGEIRGGMGVAELAPFPIDRRVARLAEQPPLHVGILIENADPVREPAELEWWARQGVVAVGMAWAKPSRYAGGNGTDLGLSDLGRGLVREMDRLGLVHDASHLSDRSLEELLELTDGPIIASHSNCRALLGGGGRGENQRHLRDESIRAIIARGGVIGLNLFSRFLIPPRTAAGMGTPGAKGAGGVGGGRATIADCVAHVERICELAGHRRAVGLGSDMDGGFSAAHHPLGIDRPADLVRLAEGLSQRGWSDGEIEGFAWRNWAEFWERRPARG